MLNYKKIIAVLPAYNAAKTLVATVNDIDRGIVDDIILVDDASNDNTVEVAKTLNIRVFGHVKNKGYGGNQKTCYQKALEFDADVAVMVHPDHQYNPKAIQALVEPIVFNEADAVFGSRMMIKGNALKGGMPIWKYISNIFLTKLENMVLKLGLTEYHSGFRAYSKKTLETLHLENNSNDFLFDMEIIVQLKEAHLRVREISIPTHYFSEASVMGVGQSIKYGCSVLLVLFKYILYKIHLASGSGYLNNK